MSFSKLLSLFRSVLPAIVIGASGLFPLNHALSWDGSYPERKTLEQGWTDDIRELFWFTSQGSRILPYDWFLALERADSAALFSDPAHMDELRYLPQSPSESDNPDGLPIGFVADVEEKSKRKWLGLTCAACHTNQIDYNGTSYLIEGAPTLANFDLFFGRLVESLRATTDSGEKFDRFSARVAESSPGQDPVSLEEMEVVTSQLELRREVNALPEGYPDDFSGHGRLDAFGQIQNAASALALSQPGNSNPPTAPVSYPFLWGTHQSDVVQWNGSATNRNIVGPLVRNAGEVVGVFGGLKVKPLTVAISKRHSYEHTVDLMGLVELESWVKQLRSPEWEKTSLPTINETLKETGRVLYHAEKSCVGCHQVIERENADDGYCATMVSLDEVGTDTRMAKNVATSRAKTYTLEGEDRYIRFGDDLEHETTAIDLAVNGVAGVLLKNLDVTFGALWKVASDEERTEWPGRGRRLFWLTGKLREVLLPDEEETDRCNRKLREGVLAYKARPLNGIWATAPYLHNGSVPTLWALLQKPEDRPTTFGVGDRKFDPNRVGYVANDEQGPFNYSTFNVLQSNGSIQPGNSNRGHEFGTDLSDDEKWALIEYLKSL